MTSQVDKTLEKLRQQQVILQQEHYRINLERFCKPTELLMRDKQRAVFKEFVFRIKTFGVRTKPKEEIARRMGERRLKRVLFGFLKGIVVSRRVQIVGEYQNFVQEREILALEMREFNLKRKAIDGWSQHMKIVAQFKRSERVKLEKGDVVGAKVEKFKLAMQEAKEAALNKQLEEEKIIRKQDYEQIQRQEQLKVLLERRKMLETELGLYEPTNEFNPAPIEEEESMGQVSDQNEVNLMQSSEDVRPTNVIRRQEILPSYSRTS